MSASLELRSLTLKRGRRTLVSDLQLELAPGELLRVEGENGAGKTTLLRAMAGLLAPAHGSVFWGGQNVARLRDEFSAQLLYLGHAPALKDDLSALENLAFASLLAGDQSDQEAAQRALSAAGLGQRLRIAARLLSQGQRRRCALARLELSRHRPLWILDEPFNALDSGAIGWLSALIDRHLEDGGSVALSTHQRQPLSAWSAAKVLSL
jgi:heme exporter protein A